MKILLVNTAERTGGAAVACGRLLEALNKQEGVTAKMLVRDKQTNHPQVIAVGHKWWMKFCFVWERFCIWVANRLSRKNLFAVDIANVGIDITRLPAFKEADIIHLHWVNQGMLSLKGIRKILASGKPVVWTMHDMWPCTGICHYAYACHHFKSECQNCPFLTIPTKKDLSNRVFIAKKNIFKNQKIHVISVSRWLAQQVEQSVLLKEMPLYVIPNTLSLDDFPLIDKQTVCNNWHFPQKHLLLFGAARIDDYIKGVDFLIEAIKLLLKKTIFSPNELHLVLFGAIKRPDLLFPRIPVSYTYCGKINSTKTLAELYSAADVTISASYYETFGQTLIEAQACGCIPVSFDNSGQTDIIQHKKNGYLAKHLSVEDLAEGIRWSLEDAPTIVSREELRNEVSERFGTDVVAKETINIYKQILDKP
ncbi:MAG: glycosyltransferase [Mediterranea massiliensis]|nr:glycosyltransferase [Mediterranea massiliensis]